MKVNKPISSQASNEEGSTTIRKEYIQVNGSAQPLNYRVMI